MAALAEAPATTNKPAQAQDWPYRFEVVALGEMFVDDAYQRPLTSFVEKIKSKFDPALIGTLTLSEREKAITKRKDDRRHFAIIDGQTRWAAMSDLGMSVAPAVAFYGLNQAQEANLFSRLQKERRGILSYHRFRAALVAGDAEPKAIVEVAQAAGYGVGTAPDQIKAVAALEAAYRRDPDILERALLIFREAWTDRWVPSAAHIRGMAYFLDHAGENTIQDERLARRLSIVSADELKRRASALREGGGHGGGSDKYMAGAIEAVYGQRKRS